MNGFFKNFFIIVFLYILGFIVLSVWGADQFNAWFVCSQIGDGKTMSTAFRPDLKNIPVKNLKVAFGSNGEYLICISGDDDLLTQLSNTAGITFVEDDPNDYSGITRTAMINSIRSAAKNIGVNLSLFKWESYEF